MKLRRIVSVVFLVSGIASAESPRPVASHPPTGASQGGARGAVILPGGSPVKSRISFTNEVSRILQDRCQTCHRAGGIAPFPLVTYEDAFNFRDAIRYMVETRQMPPFKQSKACQSMKDDPSLSAKEIETIGRWVSNGAPEGNPAEMPPAKSFPDIWTAGTPDLPLAMPQPFTPDFSNGDVYRCFVMPTSTTEDKWVTKVEVLPGARAMVHHVLLYLDTTSAAEELDARDPGPGYACFGGPGFTLTGGLGGWAPGNKPMELPNGLGMSLPKAAKVVMQVHYSARGGILEPDVTQVGITYAREPIQREYRALPIVNQTFRIPAGESNFLVTQSVPFVPASITLYSITPHMHLTGKAMQVEATLPGGAKVCLSNVPAWDFRWQGTYFYETPLQLPIGFGLSLKAWYDNSTGNPNNPHSPPRDLTWGEETGDEMCIAFLGFTLGGPVTAASADADLAVVEPPVPSKAKDWADLAGQRE
ncbi:MAG: ascorbate-dependent monooxygenase [Acidobacteria bacterium]|nr:ascorbate-dependent monooxygenase [Acidobacteriota bacterium]